MEALPALVPVIGRLAGRDLDERGPHRRTELRQARQLPGSAVDGVLDMIAPAHLLYPRGRELEQLGEHELRLLAPDPHGQADHGAWLPSARRSLAKSDSSKRRFSAESESLNSWSKSRCSSLRRRG